MKEPPPGLVETGFGGRFRPSEQGPSFFVPLWDRHCAGRAMGAERSLARERLCVKTCTWDVCDSLWGHTQPAGVGVSVSSGDTQQPGEGEGGRVVKDGVLSRSEDRAHAEDSALARWAADPANTAWMESKQPTRRGGGGAASRSPMSLVPGVGAQSPGVCVPAGRAAHNSAAPASPGRPYPAPCPGCGGRSPVYLREPVFHATLLEEFCPESPAFPRVRAAAFRTQGTQPRGHRSVGRLPFTRPRGGCPQCLTLRVVWVRTR